MNCAIILAAGEGSRMKSNMPKVLHEVLGKSMLEHVIDQCKLAGIEKIIAIVGHGSEKVREKIDDNSIIFREQSVGPEFPYGTGYAVMQGIDEIDDDDVVTIVCGDTPLITGESLGELIEAHVSSESVGSILTAVVEDSFGYGRIVRNDDNYIEKIVEQKDASDAELKINEINSGIFVFNGLDLKEALNHIDSNNSQNELYLTDVIGVLREDDKLVNAHIIEGVDEILGVNSRRQLAECNRLMQKRINNYWMDEGVTIVSPETVFIETGVTIGRDTVIHSNVHLQGNTVIGEDCTIYGQSRIINSVIGNSTSIESSVIEDSTVGSGTSIGPMAHLRPHNEVGDNVHIGNFVELKNSVFGNGSKAGHLAYIGDGDVGANVNIGCGVIFANYDGENKNRTVVKDNSFIGSNSNLVAPVTVEEGAYVAAGSTVTKDVESGALAIERSELKILGNWVENKKNKNK